MPCGLALPMHDKENKWYVDSGFFKHMIGDKSKFLSQNEKDRGGNVTFGNNSPTRIKGKGVVSLDQKIEAQNVMYVEGLKCNILSFSQMCDNGYNVTFRSKDCEICNIKYGKLVGKAVSTHNNVYFFDESRVSCYLSKTSEAQPWHKSLGHMNFDILIKISKIGAVKGLARLLRPDNNIYKSCQFGKQTKTHFKSEEFFSSRSMELIHIDICGPTITKTLKGERYFFLFIDDFTRATWILLLKEKLEEFEHFKKFKAQVENEKYLKTKFLRSEKGGEFASKYF